MTVLRNTKGSSTTSDTLVHGERSNQPNLNSREQRPAHLAGQVDIDLQKPFCMAVGALATCGVAYAAYQSCQRGIDRDVGITAWVAVAVVGAAAMITTAENA